MKRIALTICVVLYVALLPTVSRAGLVAEWTTFSSQPYTATGGNAANIGIANLSFSHTNGISVTTGTASDLAISANQTAWTSGKLELAFSGVSLPGGEITLAYDVGRSGAKSPPTQISWGFSTDNGLSFTPVFVNDISSVTSTKQTQSKTFTSPTAIGQPLVLRATFANPENGNGSVLTFGSVRISAVPEPSAFLFLGLATILGCGYRFFRGEK